MFALIINIDVFRLKYSENGLIIRPQFVGVALDVLNGIMVKVTQRWKKLSTKSF